MIKLKPGQVWSAAGKLYTVPKNLLMLPDGWLEMFDFIFTALSACGIPHAEPGQIAAEQDQPAAEQD